MSGRDVEALFVAHDLAGGGAERVLVNVLEGIAPHPVRARCLLFDSARAYSLPRAVPVDVLDLAGGPNRHARVLAVAEAIRRVAPDVIVSFLRGVNVDVALAHRVARSPARLILTEHNVASLVMTEDEMRRKAPRIRRLYRRAHRVVCVSTAVRDDVAAHFGVAAERLTVIHNPIDVERTATAARAEPAAHPWFRGTPGDGTSRTARPPVLLNVASLKARKGQALLLAAFRRVRERTPCRLVVLGEGPLRGALEAQARALGVADDVAFLGFVRNPFPFMAGSSALVVASSCEGFPNVMLEAMACGLPIVSTPWPGVTDAIESGVDGIVAARADEPSLARAMEDVVRDTALSRRLAHAAERTVRRFATGRVVPRYLALLSDDAAARS